VVIEDPVKNDRPVFEVSTAPLIFSEGAYCQFFQDGLEEEAVALCDGWFFDSELSDECSGLGAQVTFYREACVCDIAKHSDLRMHKPSVCMMAWHCMGVGLTGRDDLLRDYCDVLTLQSVAPEDANTPFIITAVVACLCVVFALLWFVILRQQRSAEAVEADEMSDVDLQMGNLDSSDKADLAFFNPMFDEGGEESRTVANPLYLSNVEAITVEEPAESEAGINYQNDEDGVLDIDMFDLGPNIAEAAFGTVPVNPTTTTSDDRFFSEPGASNLLAGAVLADVDNVEWIEVSLECVNDELTFSADGQVLVSAPLAAPIADGPGVFRLGQRAPGRFTFRGLISDICFAGGVTTAPEDGSLPGSAVGASYSLRPFAEDINGVVEENGEGAMVFDGTAACFLEVPREFQPDVSASWRLTFRMKPAEDCKGYVFAKTDPSGVTRFWSLGVIKSKSGLSMQFYYRPQGADVGHRLISANMGRFTKGTMDQEYLIMGANSKIEGDKLDDYRAGLREETYKLRSDMTDVSALRASQLNRSSSKAEKPKRRPSGKPQRKGSVLSRLSGRGFKVDSEVAAAAAASAPEAAAPIELESMDAAPVGAPLQRRASGMARPVAANTFVAARRRNERANRAQAIEDPDLIEEEDDDAYLEITEGL
jgi:hypothetical protein